MHRICCDCHRHQVHPLSSGRRCDSKFVISAINIASSQDFIFDPRRRTWYPGWTSVRRILTPPHSRGCTSAKLEMSQDIS
jgi:hypothetical protein